MLKLLFRSFPSDKFEKTSPHILSKQHFQENVFTFLLSKIHHTRDFEPKRGNSLNILAKKSLKINTFCQKFAIITIMENRISKMEKILNRCIKNLEDIENSLEEFKKLQPEFDILEKYYKSPDWRADFEADERGEISQKIPRGVLSQDGIWNTLARRDEILRIMKK